LLDSFILLFYAYECSFLYVYNDLQDSYYRQRQTSASTTPFSLAQRHLPRELLQELRMPVPAPAKAPRMRSSRVDPDEEDGVT
jgi:hypothetical protein